MSDKISFTPVPNLKTLESFISYTRSIGIDIPVQDTDLHASESALSKPRTLKSGRRIGNRFCVLPMEGWDGTRDGRPTELTIRRWKNFGLSGAKLIWGGEAAAVRPDGKCNPNQLLMNSTTLEDIRSLRRTLTGIHKEKFGTDSDLITGLQLTHSGRFSRPNDNAKLEPVIVYHHPYLDGLFAIPDSLPVITDTELDGLIGDYVTASVLAQEAGFDFVDIKHCHGYLGHELLSARTRKGNYGGSFENRTRFIREIIEGIQRDCPGLDIGVRLSVFDFPPFRADVPGGIGHSLHTKEDGSYPFAFGGDPESPLQMKLDETYDLIEMLQRLNVELICMSAGSPYYNPHIQRPAMLPPSDGYSPPEDPLLGVARHIDAAARIKRKFPGIIVVGAAYSYLQQWLPNTAEAVVKDGMADFIGLGRMMFSYPEMPSDILSGRPLQRKRICRTCSRCTTAPRQGLVSGCYLLDPLYKSRPEKP